MTVTAREFHLAARPAGMPGPETFALVTTELPDDPGPGRLLVRNTWLSVDPYMRGRMNDAKSYVPPFQLGAPLQGGAVGEVIASGAEQVPVGATVLHFLGWREYATVDAATVQVLDTSIAPAQSYLGALGMV